MIQLDIDILLFLNAFIGQWPVFDKAMVYLSGASLFKMTPMILLLVGFWFHRDGNESNRRKVLLRVLIGAIVAMALTRGLAMLLPFRARPFSNPDLTLAIPAGMQLSILDEWSSLPSDHAGLAFALAAGILLIHRRFGIVALLYSAIAICFPRAYLSFHYPSDLVAGALVGAVSVWAMARSAVLDGVVARGLSFERTKPAIFYVLLFFFAYQTSEMYDSVRNLAKGVSSTLKKSMSEDNRK